MKWQDNISKESRNELENLGGFSPTVNVKDKLLKGYLDEGQFYIDANGCRAIAKALLEASEFLESRAESEIN